MKNKKTFPLITLLALSLISCNFLSKKEVQNSTESIDILNQKEASAPTQLYTDLGTLVATINIELKATKEQQADFEDGIVPWISIEHAIEQLEQLIDGDKVIVDANEITLIIDYPLNHPTSVVLKTNEKGFTKKQLIAAISTEYIKIYTTEEKTAKTKTVPMKKRTGLINRNQTDGKYGIWGHDLADLDLSTIEIYKDKTGKISIVLGIES